MPNATEILAAYHAALCFDLRDPDLRYDDIPGIERFLRAMLFEVLATGECSNRRAAKLARIPHGTVGSWLSRHRHWLEPMMFDVRRVVHAQLTDDPFIEPPDGASAIVERLRLRSWIDEEVSSLRRGEAPSLRLLEELGRFDRDPSAPSGWSRSVLLDAETAEWNDDLGRWISPGETAWLDLRRLHSEAH